MTNHTNGTGNEPQKPAPTQYGLTLADDDTHMMRVGDVAMEISNEVVNFERRAGGLTPAALQEFVGRYLDELQPMSDRDRAIAFETLGSRWPYVSKGTADISVEEYLAELLLFVMRMAHDRAFDVFQGSYELFELWLANAETAGREATKRQRAAHLGG